MCTVWTSSPLLHMFGVSPYIKVYISQPRAPITASPSICFNCSWYFTHATLWLAHVDNLQTALGSQPLETSPRGLSTFTTGQRVQSVQQQQDEWASPSSHWDASVTLDCTPVCNQGQQYFLGQQVNRRNNYVPQVNVDGPPLPRQPPRN